MWGDGDWLGTTAADRDSRCGTSSPCSEPVPIVGLGWLAAAMPGGPFSSIGNLHPQGGEGPWPRPARRNPSSTGCTPPASRISPGMSGSWPCWPCTTSSGAIWLARCCPPHGGFCQPDRRVPGLHDDGIPHAYIPGQRGDGQRHPGTRGRDGRPRWRRAGDAYSGRHDRLGFGLRPVGESYRTGGPEGSHPGV